MDYIYGTLNKEIIPVYYTGLESDTAKVIIDNAARTIKVDVSAELVDRIKVLETKVSELQGRVAELESFLDSGTVLMSSDDSENESWM